MHFEDGLTVRALKTILADWPEEYADTGELCEVWLETGRGLTNIAVEVMPLNDSGRGADLCLSPAEEIWIPGEDDGKH